MRQWANRRKEGFFKENSENLVLSEILKNICIVYHIFQCISQLFKPEKISTKLDVDI